MDGIVELARLPIGHPDAAVRGRLARQVALVQAVARGEFHEVRHRGADKMGVARPGVAPGIDIRLHDPARVVDVGSLKAGAMVWIFANDSELPNRAAVPFPAARDAGGCDEVSAAIKIHFLGPQADYERGSAGLALRDV